MPLRVPGVPDHSHRSRHGCTASGPVRLCDVMASILPGGRVVSLTRVNGTSGTGAPDASVRLTAWVRGRVQGVGFRWWVRAQALELALVGHAANLDDGRVEVVAEGGRPACDQLLSRLATQEPQEAGQARRPGQVEGVTSRWSNARGDLTGFSER